MRKWHLVLTIIFAVTLQCFSEDLIINDKGWQLEFYDSNGPTENIGALKLISSPSGEILYTSEGEGILNWQCGNILPQDLEITKISEGKYLYEIRNFTDPNHSPILCTIGNHNYKSLPSV